MNFSEWLIAQMREREWTNSDLARKAGLSRQVIGYYLDGRVPSTEAIEKLARAFGVTIESVMRHANIIPPKTKRDELEEEAQYLFSQIQDEGRKRTALNILRTLLNENGNAKKKSRRVTRGSTQPAE